MSAGWENANSYYCGKCSMHSARERGLGVHESTRGFSSSSMHSARERGLGDPYTPRAARCTSRCIPHVSAGWEILGRKSRFRIRRMHSARERGLGERNQNREHLCYNDAFRT